MSKVHITANVRCPYYKYETAGSVIHCHGGADSEGSTNSYFKTKLFLKTWRTRYCKDQYGRCCVYKMLKEREKEV